jgi:hypothetical protein
MPTPTPWLPPIPGLHRRDPEHRYWLGEVEFPVSVTGVTGVKSDYAMERIEATREVWEPRGNSCHRALELFLQLPSRDIDDGMTVAADRSVLLELAGLLQGDYDAWIQPLITHERWRQLQVIASERPTCCLKRKVAGTFDVAYIDEDGRRILADLKSLGSESSSTYSTAAQLGGYMALEATWGNLYDAGQTIWCRPGQTTFSPLYSVAECRMAWASAWATFKARASEPGFVS